MKIAVVFLFLIKFITSEYCENTLELLEDTNHALSIGEIVPENALRYEYISEIKEKIKNYQEEFFPDPDYFLQQIIEQAEIYQPLGDWTPETVPLKGTAEGFVDPPYWYVYASYPLENGIVLTLKIQGVRTNHYYDYNLLELINQGQDWLNFYNKQEFYDLTNRPIDWQGARYHKHFVPLAKPRNYIQACLFPEEPSNIDQVRDPRKLNLKLIYTQNRKSVYIPIWNIGSLKSHLLNSTSEYIITGVR